MPLHAHLLYPQRPLLLAAMQEYLDPDVRLTTGDDIQDAATLDVLIGGEVSADLLDACPRLRAIIVPWAGLPGGLHDQAASRPQISVHNMHHNAASTAETALALLLAAARFVIPVDQALRRGDWTPRYEPPPALTVDGKTALILGYGAIGQRLARACQALGMEVLAIRRQPDATAAQDMRAEIHPPEALAGLLPRVHVLMIALPLTSETRGLIGQRELALMPPGGILVNIGRGPIVDEEALYLALQERRLAAAGIDVWYTYPQDEASRSHTMPSAFPFHELDNVAMSPHRGGAFGTEDTEQRRARDLAAMLNAASRGHPIPNRVDLNRGY